MDWVESIVLYCIVLYWIGLDWIVFDQIKSWLPWDKLHRTRFIILFSFLSHCLWPNSKIFFRDESGLLEEKRILEGEKAAHQKVSWPYHISPHSSQLTHLISPHLISPHLTSSHLISSHLIRSHYISSHLL